ncbi:unnamed protein product, partial [Mesorhabditis spiculigera]
MRISHHLLQGYRFLANRQRILFGSRREAVRDLFKTAGGSFALIAGYIIVLREFASATPDVLYDFRRATSPDFQLFATHGELAGYNQGVSMRVHGSKLESQETERRILNAQPSETRIGGGAY